MLNEDDIIGAGLQGAGVAVVAPGLEGPDEFVRVEFTCGLCGHFAAALHDLTGWPILAEYEDDGESIAHIWVLNDDGHAVDVNGVQIGAWARTAYSGEASGIVMPYPRSECVGEREGSAEDYEWAAAVISKFPHLYGIDAPREALSFR